METRQISERAMGIAAQCWTRPETAGCEMQPAVAMAMAQAIERQLKLLARAKALIASSDYRSMATSISACIWDDDYRALLADIDEGKV